jgi:hypothetical protein
VSSAHAFDGLGGLKNSFRSHPSLSGLLLSDKHQHRKPLVLIMLCASDFIIVTAALAAYEKEDAQSLQVVILNRKALLKQASIIIDNVL